jgi:hypothetical protein
MFTCVGALKQMIIQRYCGNWISWRWVTTETVNESRRLNSIGVIIVEGADIVEGINIIIAKGVKEV